MLRIFEIVPGGELRQIQLEDVPRVAGGTYISIDGSTSNTGITILTSRAVPLITMSLSADGKEHDPFRYKVNFKRVMEYILLNYQTLTNIFYEEPVIGYAGSVKALYGLLPTVPEILIEHEDEFNKRPTKPIFKEIPNQTWKRLFLAPEKIPSGTELQKEAIRRKVEAMFPWATNKVITQDECDAIGMGVACGGRVFTGLEDTITSKKKAKPFQYIAHFIGAETDLEAVSYMLDEMDSWKPKLPAKFQGGTYSITTLNGRGIFDNKVYQEMGDQDKVLILKFKSTQYQNVMLEHDMTDLASQCSYIYAVVWRKTRKGNK